MKKLLLIVVLVLIGSSIWHLSQPDVLVNEETGQETTLGPVGDRVPADVGQTVQDFVLGDYEDNLIRFSDYRGKAVVLNFWASWCPFCIEEMPLFEEIFQEFQDDGFEIIAINRAESLEQARKFSDPMNLSYELLLDKGDGVYNAYNLQAMPTTFFVDTEGVIQSIKFGPLQEAEMRQKVQDLLSASS